MASQESRYTVQTGKAPATEAGGIPFGSYHLDTTHIPAAVNAVVIKVSEYVWKASCSKRR